MTVFNEAAVTVSIWSTVARPPETWDFYEPRPVPLRRSYVGGLLAASALSCRSQSLLSSAYSTTSSWPPSTRSPLIDRASSVGRVL